MHDWQKYKDQRHLDRVREQKRLEAIDPAPVEQAPQNYRPMIDRLTRRVVTSA